MRPERGRPAIDSGDDAGIDKRLFVDALARGVKVLRAVADADSPLTVSEIARRTQLTQSTAWRLSYTLLKLGLLDQTENERVRPGLPLLGLGFSALARQRLPDLARPRMTELVDRFKGTASLAVRMDLTMVYIERITGGPMIFSGLRVGSHVSMLSAAVGWGYLAGLPAAKRKALLAVARERHPEESQHVSSELEAALVSFRKRGFIINDGLLHPQIVAIGVPIGIPGEMPVAGFSFGGPRTTFSPERLETEIAPWVLRLAGDLSRALPAISGRE